MMMVPSSNESERASRILKNWLQSKRGKEFEKLISIISNKSSNILDHDDLSQDVTIALMVALENRRVRETDDDIFYYALRVADNKIKSAFKSKYQKPTINISTLENGKDEDVEIFLKDKSVNSNPSKVYETNEFAGELVEKLHKALQALPETNRKVVVMHTLEKKGHKQIAIELDITVETSRVLKNRGMQTLRDNSELQDFFEFYSN